ncbi:MAG TPA: secretin N-terminal domain-containing protein [Blastocatellia bacterium]|nr:secretin N-terminal domain-containing protein [Blastocatellia bacterium]
MSLTIWKTFILIALTITGASQAQAQPATTQPSPAPRPSVDYVEEKGFKSRIFELRHRDPESLYNVIRTLGSGFKGATVVANVQFRTLTVRDFPENIAVMEEAIKRLDTPEAARPSIEFRIHVLIASNSAGAPAEFPSELGDVVKTLQGTLKYKNYGLMTSSIHRTQEGPSGISNKGVAESKLFDVNTPQGNPIFYNYGIRSITLDSAASGAASLRLGRFDFEMRIPLNLGTSIQYERVGFETPVTLREGEKVIVGTTTMGDKGLVIVVSAKIMR